MDFLKTKPNILLIEDVAGDIDILNHILKDEYNLFVAKTGEMGLKMATEYHPDLILLDIVLPDKTGFAVLQELKRSEETKDIPVIIITGVNSVQYEEKGLALGAVDYIVKPFHSNVMTARIRTHIRILQYIRTIEQLRRIDELTRLPNRFDFEKRFELEWKRSLLERMPLGLLVIDIAHFEDDDSSIRSDDAVLQKSAKVINKALKRADDSAFRYDDDRFIVLLPNTDPNETRDIGEEIRSGIEKISRFRNPSVVTIRIGAAAMIPDQNNAPENLIDEAEKLLCRTQISDCDSVCLP